MENSPGGKTSSTLQPANDPVVSAQTAGLLYVTDELPGMRRQRAGRGFLYRSPKGEVIKERKTLARIRALAIPPAWTQVWICLDPAGHLQATGRDERGRKQSRYHPRWREYRDETKYARMIAFGKALPKIRRSVEVDLRLPGLRREKVLAAVVRLLELSLIRVGNDEYARANDSFGLTTLRRRHVEVNGSTVLFHFRGKAGKWHEVGVRERRLARIVARCQDLPGQHLFQYLDEQGQAQDIHSEDVNDYLRARAGQDFTAKDFRTWAGTVLAAAALREFAPAISLARGKKNIVRAIESVAARLGNTVAVCRKCYVHPEVLNSYLEGSLATFFNRRLKQPVLECAHGLSPEERTVLRFLELRAAQEPQRLEKALQASLKAQRCNQRKSSSKTANKRGPR